MVTSKIYQTMDWKVESLNPTRGTEEFLKLAPTLGKFAGSVGMLVSPGWVSSTLRKRHSGDSSDRE